MCACVLSFENWDFGMMIAIGAVHLLKYLQACSDFEWVLTKRLSTILLINKFAYIKIWMYKHCFYFEYIFIL